MVPGVRMMGMTVRMTVGVVRGGMVPGGTSATAGRMGGMAGPGMAGMMALVAVMMVMRGPMMMVPATGMAAVACPPSSGSTSCLWNAARAPSANRAHTHVWLGNDQPSGSIDTRIMVRDYEDRQIA